MTSDVNVFIQCRMSSARLPGKVLRDIAGTPMIKLMHQRIKKSSLIDEIVIVTSTDSTDDELFNFCLKNSMKVFRGSLNDVLDRFYQASVEYPSKSIVRLTGDCPLNDSAVIDDVINFHLDSNIDYTSNVEPPTFPDGIDVEIFSSLALKEAWKKAELSYEREHVTPYIRNSASFKRQNFKSKKDYSHIRLTVDYQKDLDLISTIVSKLGEDVSLEKVLDFLNDGKTQEGFAIRNEGMIKSLKEGVEEKKELLAKRYARSIVQYQRANNVIPLASQTFSKSVTQLPLGASPLFMEKADGHKTWDIDGNEYLDFVNSLACITLGYNYKPVLESVKKQLDIGTIFSLPSSLESDVAELLIDIVPSAEAVRFGKNGTDVTSAAVRISRAYTKKDIVITCGYHGWQDWYIGGTTKNEGVPAAVSSLTKKFKYNDINSLKDVINESMGEVACVIMEPMNVDYPQSGFLEEVREICTQENIVLIFDEMVTGFRFSKGGAQELFNVTPDLSCFGKGIANGYPLSAIVGKKKVMDKMNDVFFSGTFGGELLSLAAAKATLEELKSKNVIDTINKTGTRLIDKLNHTIEEYKLSDFFEVKGHPSWSFFMIKDSGKYNTYSMKTFYQQEMFLNGIYTIGSHNISYSHDNEAVDQLILAYKGFFNQVKEVLNNNLNINELLCCEPIKPLFKVR